MSGKKCSFCEQTIMENESLCKKCMDTFKIKTYDMGNDGCGCDT